MVPNSAWWCPLPDATGWCPVPGENAWCPMVSGALPWPCMLPVHPAMCKVSYCPILSCSEELWCQNGYHINLMGTTISHQHHGIHQSLVGGKATFCLFSWLKVQVLPWISSITCWLFRQSKLEEILSFSVWHRALDLTELDPLLCHPQPWQTLPSHGVLSLFRVASDWQPWECNKCA